MAEGTMRDAAWERYPKLVPDHLGALADER